MKPGLGGNAPFIERMFELSIAASQAALIEQTSEVLSGE